jgi:hypothetical protein
MGLLNISSLGVLGKDKPKKRAKKIVAPGTYAEAQARYRQLSFERAALGTIEGRRETNQASIIDSTLAAIKSVFPNLDLEKDYTIPVEAADTERPATLAEIQALANSIPIPSLGAQGSTAPPLTSEEASTGLSRTTWLYLGAAGVAVIAVIFFFFRK